MLCFVFGGCHQGKWAYVKSHLVKEKTVYLDGHDVDLDLAWPVPGDSVAFNAFHYWVKRALAVGMDPQLMLEDFVQSNRQHDLIIICDDLSCGLVPSSPLDRRYRAVLGKCMQYLTSQAGQVIRVLAGVEIILKAEYDLAEDNRSEAKIDV